MPISEETIGQIKELIAMNKKSMAGVLKEIQETFEYAMMGDECVPGDFDFQASVLDELQSHIDYLNFIHTQTCTYQQVLEGDI